MARTLVDFYLDVVITKSDMTPEEREEEIRTLDEESKGLTEWPEIY